MRLDQFQIFAMLGKLNGDFKKDTFDKLCQEGGFDVIDTWAFLTSVGHFVVATQMFPALDTLDRYNTTFKLFSDTSIASNVYQKPCCGGGTPK